MRLPTVSRRSALVATCLAFCCASGIVRAAEPVITLRVGIGLKADTPQGQAITFFGERLAASSGGRIRVQLYDGGRLGDDLKMVQALRDGAQEMTCPDSSTLAQHVAALSAINYPFTFLDEREADTVLDGAWGQGLLAQLPEKGLVGLAYWENGFRQLTNNKRPIRSSSDFAGIRMRTMQNPMLIESFRHVGFEPAPMPFPKVYEALQSGAVDGQENPLPTILSSKFYEVQKHLTLSQHVYSAFVFLMSKKTWDSLTPADQKLVQTAALEARDYQRRINRERNQQALNALREKGMQVTSISREDAERTRARLRPVLDKYNLQIGGNDVVRLYIELGRLRTQGPQRLGDG